MSIPALLKESAEKACGFIGDADNLIRCLSIEFEIELGLGATVVPLGKEFEFAPPQTPLRARGAPYGNAHARRLSGDSAFVCDCFGRGDDAARNETCPAFVLAREDEDRIAFGDVLAAVHRFLRAERERLRPRIANVGFDRERHTSSRSSTESHRNICDSYLSNPTRRLVADLLFARKVCLVPLRDGCGRCAGMALYPGRVPGTIRARGRRPVLYRE